MCLYLPVHLQKEKCWYDHNYLTSFQFLPECSWNQNFLCFSRHSLHVLSDAIYTPIGSKTNYLLYNLVMPSHSQSSWIIPRDREDLQKTICCWRKAMGRSKSSFPHLYLSDNSEKHLSWQLGPLHMQGLRHETVYCPPDSEQKLSLPRTKCFFSSIFQIMSG